MSPRRDRTGARLRHGQRRREAADPWWTPGNGGKEAPAYPAAHPDVIAVTAIDADARIYKKANRGEYIDLAAPGVDVWAAKAGGGGSYRSGTSFAVPRGRRHRDRAERGTGRWSISCRCGPARKISAQGP
jgi:subtilisin family serine protease